MRIDLMIEGQEGVTWEQWVALARACEEHGLDGLFRSDHYGSLMGEDRGALDAWATLAALGAVTERIRLGTMVSPTSFRHPSVLAKCVVTADHASGGRVTLGMGAGWNEREHDRHGFRFHDVGTRMSILEEQVEIVVRQFTEDRFDFDGAHYRLEDCRALPRPLQLPRPPLVIGGSAGPRSAALAARWADEYDTPFASPAEARERRARVDRACADAGREPLAFSVMTGCVIGRDDDEVRDRAARVAARSGDVDTPVDDWLEARREHWLLGTPERILERLGDYAEAGVDAVLLQHLDHTDLGAVALMGQLVDGLA